MQKAVKKLKDYISDTDNIVFFGGAGVSTESGIPDFRSADGIYEQAYKCPPETILSRTFFLENPKEFYEFYRKKMLHLNAKPNAAHIKLAQLEERGKLKAIITQNVDGLHQKAGSRNVYELHGSVYQNFCMECGKAYDVSAIAGSEDGIPHCDCGGIIRPNVILFEEALDIDIIRAAVRCISNADVLIVGGTSLGVYPAAGFIDYYRGDKLVMINKSKTPYDYMADLIINGSIGEVFDY